MRARTPSALTAPTTPTPAAPTAPNVCLYPIRSALTAPTGPISSLILVFLLIDKILHDPKDPKLWELW